MSSVLWIRWSRTNLNSPKKSEGQSKYWTLQLIHSLHTPIFRHFNLTRTTSNRCLSKVSSSSTRSSTKTTTLLSSRTRMILAINNRRFRVLPLSRSAKRNKNLKILILPRTRYLHKLLIQIITTRILNYLRNISHLNSLRRLKVYLISLSITTPRIWLLLKIYLSFELANSQTILNKVSIIISCPMNTILILSTKISRLGWNFSTMRIQWKIISESILYRLIKRNSRGNFHSSILYYELSITKICFYFIALIYIFYILFMYSIIKILWDCS